MSSRRGDWLPEPESGAWIGHASPSISARKAAVSRCSAGVPGTPSVDLIHRIPNGPVHRGASLRWPLDTILAGLEEGLRKAAQAAPEGIASIAVDGWAVDYVRLDADGNAARRSLLLPRRAHRRLQARCGQLAAPPEDSFAAPARSRCASTPLYQLLADPAPASTRTRRGSACPSTSSTGWAAAASPSTPTPPTPASSISRPATGLATSFERFGIPLDAAPPIVPAGTVVGRVAGPAGRARRLPRHGS